MGKIDQSGGGNDPFGDPIDPPDDKMDPFRDPRDGLNDRMRFRQQRLTDPRRDLESFNQSSISCKLLIKHC
jgi:hypothetical protein